MLSRIRRINAKRYTICCLFFSLASDARELDSLVSDRGQSTHFLTMNNVLMVMKTPSRDDINVWRWEKWCGDTNPFRYPECSSCDGKLFCCEEKRKRKRWNKNGYIQVHCAGGNNGFYTPPSALDLANIYIYGSKSTSVSIWVLESIFTQKKKTNILYKYLYTKWESVLFHRFRTAFARR